MIARDENSGRESGPQIGAEALLFGASCIAFRAAFATIVG